MTLEMFLPFLQYRFLISYSHLIECLDLIKNKGNSAYFACVCKAITEITEMFLQ